MNKYKYYILAEVPGVARGIYKIELWRKKSKELYCIDNHWLRAYTRGGGGVEPPSTVEKWSMGPNMVSVPLPPLESWERSRPLNIYITLHITFSWFICITEIDFINRKFIYFLISLNFSILLVSFLAILKNIYLSLFFFLFWFFHFVINDFFLLLNRCEHNITKLMLKNSLMWEDANIKTKAPLSSPGMMQV